MMYRPLNTAFVLSIAVHLLFFLFLAQWQIQNPAPASDNVLNVLSYRSGQLEEGVVAAERPANTELETAQNEAPPKPEQPVVEQATPATVVEKAVPTTSPPIPVPVEQVTPEVVEPSPEPNVVVAAKAASPVPFQKDVLTTLEWSDRRLTVEPETPIEPVFETAPMSAKQEKMLKKKFKQWTENFYKMDAEDATMAWEYKGQAYKATFNHLPAEDDMSIDEVMVEISTDDNGRTLSTEMRMRRLAFSNFAQFVNRWDPNVQIHNDELDGRFHANTEISLGYTRKAQPKFHGKVTTSSRGVRFGETTGRVRRAEMFLGGLETGVRRIQLPKEYFPFPAEDAVGEDQIHRLDGHTRLFFYADGTYEYGPTNEPQTVSERSLAVETTYIIGGPKCKVFVSGTVRGKVLVYSPERIVIEGSLRYATDPSVDQESGDYLGLVSDKYVDIAHPDVTGQGDLRVDASIYAKRRFAVKNYRFRDESLLHIYGSLTAGSLSASEPRYATKIEFDKRLESLRAPGFPLTNRYEMTTWDGQWRTETVDEERYD